MNMRRLGMAALVVVLVWAAAVTVLLVSNAVMAGKASAAPLAAAAATTPAPKKTPAPATTPAPAQPRTANRAWLGVSLANVDAQVAQQYGLSDQTGVVIASVTADSPAAQAGMKEGDQIKSVNGVAVTTTQVVVAEVGKAKVGDTITLAIVRGGQPMTIKATLGQAPATTMPGGNQGQAPQGQQTPAPRAQRTPAPNQTPAPVQPRTSNRAWLGVSLATIDAQVAQQYNLSDQTGVVIASVTADSPAAQAGLKEGDQIKSVNGVAVTSTQSVVTEVGKAKVGDAITLAIVRGGQPMTIKATAGQAPATTLPGGNQGQAPQGQQTPGQPPQRAPQGNAPAMPSELNPLQGVPQDQLFSHDLGSSRTYTDKDGKLVTINTVPGVVTSISSSSISLTPNNPLAGGGPYSIDQTTVIRAGRGLTGTSAIAVKDQVTITTVAGSKHASLISKGGSFQGGQPFQMPGRGDNGEMNPPVADGSGSVTPPVAGGESGDLFSFIMPFLNGQSNNGQGNNGQGNNGQLQLPPDFLQNLQKYLGDLGGNGQGSNGQFQLPPDFLQNPQKYLGDLGGLLNRLIPQLQNPQQAPGQGL